MPDPVTGREDSGVVIAVKDVDGPMAPKWALGQQDRREAIARAIFEAVMQQSWNSVAVADETQDQWRRVADAVLCVLPQQGEPDEAEVEQLRRALAGIKATAERMIIQEQGLALAWKGVRDRAAAALTAPTPSRYVTGQQNSDVVIAAKDVDGPIAPEWALGQQDRRQRQDSLDAQLRTVFDLARRAGCYDAADWMNRHFKACVQQGEPPEARIAAMKDWLRKLPLQGAMSDSAFEGFIDRQARHLYTLSQQEVSVAKIEQRLENDQVRRMQQTGRCPTCGADA